LEFSKRTPVASQKVLAKKKEEVRRYYQANLLRYSASSLKEAD
jgi:hypothetical protein